MNQDRIGIGRITCRNRRLRDLRMPMNAIYREFFDEERRGPAYARNWCLKQLMDADCDFIFLFDDDCYPIMDGWAEYFIEHSRLSNVDFFGLPESFKSTLHHLGEPEVVYWSNIIGCFNFQTRRFMNRVGYYNPAFKGYGYEDSARNNRAMRSGLCGDNWGNTFPSLLRAPSYIFSEDVYARNPTPNMTDAEKAEHILRNRPICLRENASPQIYYGWPGP